MSGDIMSAARLFGCDQMIHMIESAVLIDNYLW